MDVTISFFFDNCITKSPLFDKSLYITFLSSKYVEGITVRVSDSVIKSTTVRNLGAVLDSHLDMEQHVNSVSRSCFMKIRQIGQIRKYLTVDSTRTLINSLVTSKLDYCNSLLYGSPKYVLNKLQNVQNTAARVITNTTKLPHNPSFKGTTLAACAHQSRVQTPNICV